MTEERVEKNENLDDIDTATLATRTMTTKDTTTLHPPPATSRETSIMDEKARFKQRKERRRQRNNPSPTTISAEPAGSQQQVTPSNQSNRVFDSIKAYSIHRFSSRTSKWSRRKRRETKNTDSRTGLHDEKLPRIAKDSHRRGRTTHGTKLASTQQSWMSDESPAEFEVSQVVVSSPNEDGKARNLDTVTKNKLTGRYVAYEGEDEFDIYRPGAVAVRGLDYTGEGSDELDSYGASDREDHDECSMDTNSRGTGEVSLSSGASDEIPVNPATPPSSASSLEKQPTTQKVWNKAWILLVLLVIGISVGVSVRTTPRRGAAKSLRGTSSPTSLPTQAPSTAEKPSWSPTSPPTGTPWLKQGEISNNIPGFGSSISVCVVGSYVRVAVGDESSITVYQSNASDLTTWTDVGQEIFGTNPQLVANGGTIAVMQNNESAVQVMELKDTQWVLKGSAIFPQLDSSGTGTMDAFAISDDGLTVAIGVDLVIQVFSWSGASTAHRSWTRLGGDIVDSAMVRDLSLSLDGSTVATAYETTDGSTYGYVYRLVRGKWEQAVQRNQALRGGAAIVISGDGLALTLGGLYGATFRRLDSSSDVYDQHSVVLEETSDEERHSVDMSLDGSLLAIGSSEQINAYSMDGDQAFALGGPIVGRFNDFAMGEDGTLAVSSVEANGNGGAVTFWRPQQR